MICGDILDGPAWQIIVSAKQIKIGQPDQKFYDIDILWGNDT